MNNGRNRVVEEMMLAGNIPIAGPGRQGGMMGGGGGVVPPALLEESRVPKFYKDAIVACGATQPHMLPHTGLVYNLMVTSGLNRQVLSYVWSAVNRTLPGQLTRQEFFSCLALIALAQKHDSLAALSTMSSLPIPHLQTVQVPSQNNAPTIGFAKNSTDKAMMTGTIVPTSLMSDKRTKVKNVDLIGGVLDPSSSSRTARNSSQSSSNVSGSSGANHVYTDNAPRCLIPPPPRLNTVPHAGSNTVPHTESKTVSQTQTSSSVSLGPPPAGPSRSSLRSDALRSPTTSELSSIDLLSGIRTDSGTTTSSQGRTELEQQQSTSANYDLSGVDWSSMSNCLSTSNTNTTTMASTSDRNTLNSSSSEQQVSFSKCDSFSSKSSSFGFSRGLSALSGWSRKTEEKPTTTAKQKEVIDERLTCWIRTIAAAHKLYQDCNQLLNGASQEVLTELFSTEKGDNYLKCLFRLEWIVERVLRSGEAVLPADCRNEAEQCRMAWKRLARFARPSNSERPHDHGELICGICSQAMSESVQYSSKSFHPECANLWVNAVDPLLPNMHLSY